MQRRVTVGYYRGSKRSKSTIKDGLPSVQSYGLIDGT